ncbi:hypothetical protein DFS34DRAFT_648857 [Phlyctochytrium arcticum]|nr:hypothetical protein DFS34DRAFT_648857 [Phlyctochytrium arcticum]
MDGTSTDPPPQPTLGDLIDQLSNEFRTVYADNAKIEPLTGSAGQPPECSVPNFLHSLALNPVAVKADLLKSINEIETVLTRYRDETISPAATTEAFDSPVVNEYFQLLKSRTGQLTTLAPFRSVVGECLDVVKDRPIPIKSLGRDATIKRLEQVTLEVGLQFFCGPDLEDSSLLAVVICGDVVVADIHISPSADITKTTLTFAMPDSAEHSLPDVLADTLLLDMIKLGDFSALKQALAYLALLDTNKGENLHYQKAMEADLAAIHEIERANMGADMESIMAEGHGIPVRHLNQLGPTLVYWATAAARLDIDWGLAEASLRSILSNTGICRAYIKLEPSTPTWLLGKSQQQYLVPGNDPNFTIPPADQPYYNIIQGQSWHNAAPLNFFNPIPNSISPKDLCFYIKLQPAIAVTTLVARRIAAKGREGAAATDATDDGEMAAGNDVDENFAGLSELLTRDVAAGGDKLNLQKFSARIPIRIATTKNETISPANPSITNASPTQSSAAVDLSIAYRYVAPQDSSAVVINSIPCAHPRHIYSIFQLLRRQLVFNALFRSCFNVHTFTMGLPRETGNAESGVATGAVSDGQTGSAVESVQVMLLDWSPPETLVFLIRGPLSDAGPSTTATTTTITAGTTSKPPPAPKPRAASPPDAQAQTYRVTFTITEAVEIHISIDEQMGGMDTAQMWDLPVAGDAGIAWLKTPFSSPRFERIATRTMDVGIVLSRIWQVVRPQSSGGGGGRS